MLLQVVDQPPYVCAYIYPNPTVVGYATNFQYCSYDPDGYIVSSVWDFGDGGQASVGYATLAATRAGSVLARLTRPVNGANVVKLPPAVSVKVNWRTVI